jgi:hypothetical protein
MSAPPRGPRGGRGPRVRGSGRGGANTSRTRPSNGNESDTASSGRPLAARGRGRGTNSQNTSRGIAQAFQQVTRQQNGSRGSKNPRGGSRATTPTPNGITSNFGSKKSNETIEERFHRLRSRREDERQYAIKNGLMSGEEAVSLEHAVSMVGTCQDMCGEYERARRIYQREVPSSEMVCMAILLCKWCMVSFD